MAEKLGITERAYLNMEKDKNKTIDLYRIQEIADILEVDFWDLIEKETENKVNITHYQNKGKNKSNYYSSTPIELSHENEKLHLENSFLKKEISLLEDKIKDLEEKIDLMKKS